MGADTFSLPYVERGSRIEGQELPQDPHPTEHEIVKLVKRKEEWNRNVPRDELIKRAQERIEFYRTQEPTLDHIKKIAYVATLLIQSHNGLRIGEAYSTLHTWLDIGERLVKVRVEKKKEHVEYKLCPTCSLQGRKRRYSKKDTRCARCGTKLGDKVYVLDKKPDMALVEVPAFITDEDREKIRGIRDYLGTKDAVRMHAYSEIGVNSHTQRFSFVRELRRQGKTPDEAANIMHHSSSTVTRGYFDMEDEDSGRLAAIRKMGSPSSSPSTV